MSDVPRGPTDPDRRSSSLMRPDDPVSVASLHGAFILALVVLGTGVAYFAMTSTNPPLSASFAIVVCETTFAAAATLTLGLALLLASGPVWLAPRPLRQGLRILDRSFSPGQRILLGPMAASLVLMALSGPVLLGTQPSSPIPQILIIEVSLFLLGAWGVLGLWIASAAVVLLRFRARSMQATARDAGIPPAPVSRPWLRPLPAVVIAAILLVLVAYPLPSESVWRIDGDMSKWATVPGHLNPAAPVTVTASGPSVSLDYPVPGNYNATLNVTDSNGAQAETTVSFRVPNLPPSANFSVTVLGMNVTADASASRDSDGSITLYRWQFGDGGVASGPVATHTYYASGTYNLTLTVTDNEGASSWASRSVTVRGPNRPPLAVIVYILQDYNLTVNGASSTDPEGSVVSYAWSFGDGGSAATENATHAYTTNGTYGVTLTVADDGGASSAANVSVMVPHAAPSPRFTFSIDYLYVAFNATASTADGPIASYLWFFGDGGTGVGAVTTHRYGAAGKYFAILSVQDGAGAVSSLRLTVNVSAPPPSSVPPVPVITTTVTGLYVTFRDQGSYDPDGTIVAAYWAFGDGATAEADTVGHLYAGPGTYTASLTLVDNDGLFGESHDTIDLLPGEPGDGPPVPNALVQVAGTIVTLYGTSSFAVNASIVLYRWALPSPSPGLQLVEVKAVRTDGWLFLYARAAGPVFSLPSTQTAVTFYLQVPGHSASTAVDGVNASFALRIVGADGTAGPVQLAAFAPSSLPGFRGDWYVVGSGDSAVSGAEVEVAVPISALLISSSVSVRTTCAMEVFRAAASVLAQPFDV